MKRFLSSLIMPALAFACILPVHALTTQEITSAFRAGDVEVEDVGDRMIQIGPYICSFASKTGENLDSSSDKQIARAILFLVSNAEFAEKYNMEKLTARLESELGIDLMKLSDEAYAWSIIIDFQNINDNEATKALLTSMDKLMDAVEDVTKR